MAENLNELADLGEDGVKLRRLGFTSVAQVIRTVPVAEQALSTYLGHPIRDVLPPLIAAGRPRMLDALIQPASVPYAMGARTAWVGPAAIGAIPSAPTAGQPQNRYDFVSELPALKNQARRETCVAFASVAVLERHMSLSNAYLPMSEQFAYWQTKGLDGESTVPGSWLRYAFLGLQVQGCCSAATWPYQLTPTPGDEPGGDPPTGAVTLAIANVQPNTQSIWPTDIDSILSVISSGRGVGFSVPLFPSSYGATGAPATYTQQTGDFLNPIPGETTVGGHAMCIVGYFGLLDQPENGYGRFIVRNSWNDPNTPWAPQPNWGLPAGYGTISFMYIRMYCEEANSIA